MVIMTHESLSVGNRLVVCRSEPKDLKKIDRTSAIRMLFQIHLINSFERWVMELKEAECINGPIHISIGQEAIAAATMATLRAPDRITGSHRAHHHFLAKALNYTTPTDWDPSQDQPMAEVREVVWRTLSEIMGLSAGYCGGRGGSMHLRWGEAGILGTNAIVSGGVPLSTGAAFADNLRQTGNVVVAFLGDGGVNQGSFHEAANMASLWNLPIIFFIENNQYAVGTSVRDASSVPNLSQHALGHGMDGRIVYGYDVAGVFSTMTELVSAIRNGGGPAVVEAKCYRHYHHGGALKGSKYGYRDSSEEAEWLSNDALTTYPASLVEQGVLSSEAAERIRETAEEIVLEAVQRCTVKEKKGYSIPAELWPDRSTVSLGMRSDGSELQSLSYDDFPSAVSFGVEAAGPTSGIDGRDKNVETRLTTQDTQLRELRYSDAIAEVTGSWLERAPEVFVLGEEVASFGGGAYGATKGLPSRFPNRVLNTPISEGGFSGLALGMAMSGMRPVVEIMFPDFTLVAADQIFNQIAKARHMYGGTTDIPLVLRTRIATGCGYGGQHSMDPIGLYAMFSGWRIVAPSCSADYIGLFNTAMHSLDPVLVLEHHSLYGLNFLAPPGTPDYCIPFGKAAIVRPGSDITVVGYGAMVRRLVEIAKELQKRGVSAEVIDLRTLDFASIDFEALGESLDKTGSIAIVEEAAEGNAIGRRIASEVTERFFDRLDAPPGCISSLDVPNSVSRVLEETAIIDDQTIIELLVRMGKRSWK